MTLLTQNDDGPWGRRPRRGGWRAERDLQISSKGRPERLALGLEGRPSVLRLGVCGLHWDLRPDALELADQTLELLAVVCLTRFERVAEDLDLSLQIHELLRFGARLLGTQQGTPEHQRHHHPALHGDPHRR